MKLQKIYRSSALFCAALLGFAAAALPAAAEVELEEDEYILEQEEEEVPTFECGDYTYSKLDAADGSSEQAACIEKYTGTETEPEIPAELDGLPVVELGRYAFANAEEITAVTLPESLTTLGLYAFVNCSQLTEFRVDADNPQYQAKDGILFDKEGTTLERYPLGRHPETYTVEEGITGIGNVAFATSTTLQAITLPESLTYIGTAAFSDCPRLGEITIPSGVTAVSDFMANNCRHLKTVNLPETITSIGYAAFAATGLESFTIPSSCTSIGDQALADTNLAEIIIPKTVEEIGEKAFGFKLDENGELHKDPNFIIGGELGTAGETYARIGEEGSSFEFVNVGAEPEPTEPVQPKSPVGKIIGIVCCVLALIAILVISLFGGKKKAKKTASEEAQASGETETAGEEETDETDTAEAEPETAEAEEAAPAEDASEEETGDE